MKTHQAFGIVYNGGLRPTQTQLTQHRCFTAKHIFHPIRRHYLLIQAWDNLTGEEWDTRTSTLSHQHGNQPIHRPLNKPINVQGVGTSSQQATQSTTIPGQLENGARMTYSAPVIPRSGIPALLGLKSMETLGTVLDMRNNERKMYIGSDTKIVPGPNTTVLQLYKANSGHLMLPMTEYNSKTTKQTLQFHQHSSSSAASSSEQGTNPTNFGSSGGH